MRRTLLVHNWIRIWGRRILGRNGGDNGKGHIPLQANTLEDAGPRKNTEHVDRLTRMGGCLKQTVHIDKRLVFVGVPRR